MCLFGENLDLWETILFWAGGFAGIIILLSLYERSRLSSAFSKIVLGFKKSRDEIESYKQRIKELEHANDDLKMINQELDDFACIVSHDLKEPLRVIKAFSNFVYKDCKDKLTAEGIDYLEKIKTNISYMEELVNDLLEFSRISRRKNPFEEVDINLLVEEVKQSFMYAIDEKKADFIIKDNLPTVFCDQLRIKEVFSNLITNALKFMDKSQPKIEIGANQAGDFYCFYVRDNGIGIEKQYFDEIFQIFHKSQHKDKYEGTGVGLTICKKIVEQHCGKIWVDSEPDKGATFYFTLPKEKSYHERE